MAKLSDRQKENIKSKWHTGQYTKSYLAKAYKVNEKTIRDIVGKEEPRNADIVEAATIVEIAKNSEKTPSERAAIEVAVKERLSDVTLRAKIDTATLDVLEGVSKLIKGGTKVELVTEGQGKGFSQVREVEVGLGSGDYKAAQETIDKASITLGVNQRHANSQINIDNTNTQQAAIKVDIENATPKEITNAYLDMIKS